MSQPVMLPSPATSPSLLADAGASLFQHPADSLPAGSSHFEIASHGYRFANRCDAKDHDRKPEAVVGKIVGETMGDETRNLIRLQVVQAASGRTVQCVHKATLSGGQTRAVKAQAAVFFIDLARFKAVSHSLGHHMGDLLLSEIALRSCSSVREADLVARLGGDEFLVALTNIATERDVAAVALKLLAAISAEPALDGHKITVSPSTGMTPFPRDGPSVDELVRQADMAMDHAKDRGRNTYQFFDPAVEQRPLAAEALRVQQSRQPPLDFEEGDSFQRDSAACATA